MSRRAPGPPRVPPPPPPVRPPPPPPGPRRVALEDRRKRARSRALLLGGALAVLLIAGIALALGMREPAREAPGSNDDPIDVVRSDDPQSTLLAGTRSVGGRARLIWAVLLVLDPDAERSSVVYVPPPTGTEVPGRGPHPLSEAFATGGMSLLALSAENLLGVRVDRHVELSEQDARSFFRSLAPLEVDVPGEFRVPRGDGTQLLFEPGTQSLDGDALTAYAYRMGEEGTPESMGSRHLALWRAMFERGAADPEEVERSLTAAAGSLEGSRDEPDEVAGFLSSFLTEPSSRDVRSLPVTPLEVPGEGLYVADEAEVRAFVSDLVGEELLTRDEARVQILNGVGAPGVGQRVARRLVGHGFRVALTGNARSLNHRRTLIITYDNSDEGRDRAARARELLGVGEVQVSLQEQGIVDLTIVIGRDFLRAQ